ncbi:MAG TPA: TadE/TadG family type IV pilus assembly protein [Nocardioidaceae bacterium]|nr:TadE/TadG family type IV pilus assembly protein [Nocardioidaceae bacterium]
MSGVLAWRRRRFCRRSERAAVAVEFALVVPVLVMLLIGTITTGVSYSQALGVTNAVREGARFGATANAADASWTTDVISRVRATQFDDPGLSTSVCVEFWQNGSMTKESCPSGGPGLTAADKDRYELPPAPAGVCLVRVVAARNFTISAPPLFSGTARKLVRGSVARYERTDKVPSCA